MAWHGFGEEVTLIRHRVKSHQHFSSLRVGVNGCGTFFGVKRFFSHLSIEKRKIFSSQWWMIRKAICKCLLVGRGSADNSLWSRINAQRSLFLQRRLENTQKSRCYWSVVYTSQIYRCALTNASLFEIEKHCCDVDFGLSVVSTQMCPCWEQNCWNQVKTTSTGKSLSIDWNLYNRYEAKSFKYWQVRIFVMLDKITTFKIK